MSIIANNLLQGDEGYNISRSLRLRSSASAYLNRTISTDGSLRKGTFSFWIKRANNRTDGEPDNIYQSANTGDNNYRAFLNMGTNGGTASLQIYAYDSAGNLVLNIATSAVYRDPSSWYHIVFAFDTTQATSSDRAKVYVNGVQQTALSSATYPSQNTDLGYFKNLSSGTYIGANRGGASPYASCYLTEYNVVDGQALTPSSFGETDLVTGVWKAKKYGGTYGTNGFYLPFSDNTSTTTLGYDQSGNSNNWTTNNISLTAGSTYDSMVDVPTMSALASNYCVLNPLRNHSNNTISSGNLNVLFADSTNSRTTFATFGLTSGKWYWETTVTATGNNTYYPGVGINTDLSFAPSGQSGDTSAGYMYLITGQKFNNGSLSSYGSSFTTNDVIGVALDMDAGTITFYKNNTSQGQAFSGITGTAVPCFIGYTNASCVSNFGQRPFSYTPPTGFVALNTFNLPEPSIKAGNKYMDATTYSGNGTSQTITNASGFAPDFVWIKGRNYADNHTLWNTVVGAQKSLSSDTTTAETTRANALTAFASNGFTLGTDTIVNYSAGTYVGWQWKANGAGSSNTAGSITSTVSANPTAGFSVVTYSANGSTGTVGHGLGVAPKMIIVKKRNAVERWCVYHTSISNGYIYLNETFALETGNAQLRFGDNSTVVQPTSSVFSVGSANDVNASGGTYVAYCFAEVAGYSKFGSYTGNGSTDGAFVHLGFRPKFVMIKLSSNAGEGWILNDTSRSPYNVAAAQLQANSSGAEVANDVNTYIDDLSNGFKIRTTAGSHNTSGYTYIYMAFAENPFKYSLAR